MPVLPGPVTRAKGGVLLLPATRPRPEVAADILTVLRRSGLRLDTPTGWEDHDAMIRASFLVRGQIVTSSFPEGCIQLRVRRRVRWPLIAFVGAATAASAPFSVALAALIAVAGAIDLAVGSWRTGPNGRRAIARACA